MTKEKWLEHSAFIIFIAFIGPDLSESNGAWCLVLELGRRLTDTSLDKLKKTYLFHRLSVAVQPLKRHLLFFDLI